MSSWDEAVPRDWWRDVADQLARLTVTERAMAALLATLAAVAATIAALIVCGMVAP